MMDAAGAEAEAAEGLPAVRRGRGTARRGPKSRSESGRRSTAPPGPTPTVRDCRSSRAESRHDSTFTTVRRNPAVGDGVVSSDPVKFCRSGCLRSDLIQGAGPTVPILPITPGDGAPGRGRESDGGCTHGGGAMVKHVKRLAFGAFAAAGPRRRGCVPINQYASDPVIRMDQLINQSEDYRQIGEFWRRFWFNDMPVAHDARADARRDHVGSTSRHRPRAIPAAGARDAGCRDADCGKNSWKSAARSGVGRPQVRHCLVSGTARLGIRSAIRSRQPPQCLFHPRPVRVGVAHQPVRLDEPQRRGPGPARA